MKLSIIIPAYNAEPYIDELLNRLEEQITPEVEVVIIDDGSEKPYKRDGFQIYRQENQGVSAARNKGLELSRGEYIHFIDADDLVPPDYIKYILQKIDTERFDFMELSWKSLPGSAINYNFKLNSINDHLENPSVCTRIYKRDFIGAVRFNTAKDAAEDEDFNRRLDLSRGKRAVATLYMYYYRTDVPGSKSKKYLAGVLNTRRIVYFYRHITPDMTWLVEEIKEENEKNEVFILTEQNDIPELAKYAQIWKPTRMRAAELRGEHTSMVSIIKEPIKTQVCIYTQRTSSIGGIETFIYNFCRIMAKYYDILVLYDAMDGAQIARLLPFVPVKKRDDSPIICDTLIMNRIFDDIPANVQYKQTVQMIHACRDAIARSFPIPQDRTHTVCVSSTSLESFEPEELKNARTIPNLMFKEPTRSPLLLVSATRLDTPEKGKDRMRRMGWLMKEQGVPFIWLYFSNTKIDSTPSEMIHMQPTLRIADFIQKADYLVQLSDTEGFGYTIAEAALLYNTPVITTPLPILDELGIAEDINAHIVPFDLDGIDTREFLNIPKVKGNYSNKNSIAKWRRLLGDTKPTGAYKPEDIIPVRVLKRYEDTVLHRTMEPGDVICMKKDRARGAQAAGFAEIIEEVPDVY